MSSFAEHNRLNDQDIPALADLILNRQTAFDTDYMAPINGHSVKSTRYLSALLDLIEQRGKSRGLTFVENARVQSMALVVQKGMEAEDGTIAKNIRLSLVWDYTDDYLAENTRPSVDHLKLMLVVRWADLGSRTRNHAQKFIYAH